METKPYTIVNFVAQVRELTETAERLGFKPKELVINPEILRLLSAESEFHKLQEFSQSRIIQDSPKLRFLRISESLVLTIVEKRHEFMFHLE